MKRRDEPAAGSGDAFASADAPPEPGELEAVYQDLQGMLVRERGVRAFMRSRSTPLRWLLAASLPVACALGMLWLAPRVDLAFALREPLPGLAVVILLCLAAVFVRLLRPLHQLEPSPRNDALLGWLTVSVPALLAFWPGSASAGAAPERDCLPIGILLGGAQIAWLCMLLRNSTTRSRLLLPAAGGMTANLALILHCPGTTKLHGLIAHASVALWLMLFLQAGRLVQRVVRTR